MGIDQGWQQDFLNTAKTVIGEAIIGQNKTYYIVDLKSFISIHLISLSNSFSPLLLVSLQHQYQKKGIQLIHLWEDVWLSKRQQVISRIRSFAGKNKTIHGRKTVVRKITSPEAKIFLNQHHLQGFVTAKYYYGLFINDEIIAVANFSATRLMKSRGDNHQSAELVRFATRSGFTVQGGLSKLIKYFLKQVKVDDLMTYADRDWSLGKGYDQLDFCLTSVTQPIYLYLDKHTFIRYVPHRLPKAVMEAFERQNLLNLDDFLRELEFVKVFNTGNLKYIFYP